MIVTAVALLVLATIFLVIGILSSSVAWLVISLLATLAAAGTLVASFAHYRRRALIAPPAGYPGAYVAETPPPQPPLPSTATAAAPVVAAPAATVLAGWDGRSAADCVRIVSTLSLDELHAVRRHEVEGKHRKTVLAAIDARIDEIVSVRRSYQTSS